MRKKMLTVLCLPTIAILLAAAFYFTQTNSNIIDIKDANVYSVTPASCTYLPNVYASINFYFESPGKIPFQAPKYSIQEDWEIGKTQIIFENAKSVFGNFLYNEIADNPLVLNLNYYNAGENFIVEIERNGSFLPAKVKTSGSKVGIILEDGGASYPIFFEKKPNNNSAAYPSPLRGLSFKVKSAAPLISAIIYFQGKRVTEISQAELADNEYLFSFKGEVVKDDFHTIKAIITDSGGRTAVSAWTFQGRIPIEGILGLNRFQYLGWWGEINMDGISVRKGPNRSSLKLGTLSSINRVKVLKEVYGEDIDGNNIWYEIDGGANPHSYVFSEFVTPMVQPEPPEIFIIPEGVTDSDYWIDVDLTKNIFTLFLYNKPVLVTYIASGRPENPTEAGTFQIWWKITKKRMRGGPPLHLYVYDLSNVPHVLFYNGAFAIHGTYWHDKFGSQQSAGCTNMTQGDAAFVFERIKPTLPAGISSVISSGSNPGTIVHNHY